MSCMIESQVMNECEYEWKRKLSSLSVVLCLTICSVKEFV
jgi:hypothetical protein